MTKDGKADILVGNNTDARIDKWLQAALIKAIKDGGRLPPELDDIFTLKVIVVDGQTRGILNWA